MPATTPSRARPAAPCPACRYLQPHAFDPLVSAAQLAQACGQCGEALGRHSGAHPHGLVAAERLLVCPGFQWDVFPLASAKQEEPA